MQQDNLENARSPASRPRISEDQTSPLSSGGSDTPMTRIVGRHEADVALRQRTARDDTSDLTRLGDTQVVLYRKRVCSTVFCYARIEKSTLPQLLPPSTGD